MQTYLRRMVSGDLRGVEMGVQRRDGRPRRECAAARERAVAGDDDGDDGDDGSPDAPTRAHTMSASGLCHRLPSVTVLLLLLLDVADRWWHVWL